MNGSAGDMTAARIELYLSASGDQVERVEAYDGITLREVNGRQTTGNRLTYTSANEVVDIDYVRVRKPDGTVVKTPDYNIQDMPGEVTRSASSGTSFHRECGICSTPPAAVSG